MKFHFTTQVNWNGFCFYHHANKLIPGIHLQDKVETDNKLGENSFLTLTSGRKNYLIAGFYESVKRKTIAYSLLQM